MNPRQRRGLTFILVAMVVAVGTFLAVTSYAASVNSQVGSRVTVYRATEQIEPFTALSAGNLEAIEIPERWVSKTSILSLKDLQGRRLGFRLNAGTILASDMLVAPSDLNPNEREVAINVDAVTGVAGRVRPGDRVDIVVTYKDVEGEANGTRVLVREVRVVTVRGQQTVTQRGENGVSQESVIPVTLALKQPDMLAVLQAAIFAQRVGLVALPLDVGVTRDGEIGIYPPPAAAVKPKPAGAK